MVPPSQERLSPLLVSAAILDAAAVQFNDTGKLHDRLRLENKITLGEYRAWAKFAEDFHPIYKAAVDAWEQGQRTGRPFESFNTMKNALRDHFIFATSKQGG